MPTRRVIHAWPRQMRAETAAAYVDEVSVEAFLRACGQGKLYPSPKKVEGKGDRWLIEDLDAALERIHGRPPAGESALKALLRQGAAAQSASS